jgi:hypothetical protein
LHECIAKSWQFITSGGSSSSNAQKNNQVQALANDQTPLTIQKVYQSIFGQTAFPGLLSLAKNLQQQQYNVKSRSQQ